MGLGCAISFPLPYEKVDKGRRGELYEGVEQLQQGGPGVIHPEAGHQGRQDGEGSAGSRLYLSGLGAKSSTVNWVKLVINISLLLTVQVWLKPLLQKM